MRPTRTSCLLLSLLLAGPVSAQSTPPAPAPAAAEPAAFTDEKLEAIAAPVALYPDGLLMQIFMASTYPLEVVEAQRWSAEKKLSGKALDEGLKGQDWDPSVKSLCSFPDVLKRMSENLDWTRDMGDAFLEQQSQLLDAVQRLRDKAYAAGNLKTTEQQTITVKEDKIIVIEPANPEVIYVPSYSPTVVYGGWPYPTSYYPPLYAPPPAGYGLLAFGAGMAVGAAIWGDCDWGWGHGECNVNINNSNNFNRNTSNNFQQINNKEWNHNAEHRKGVNYRDGKTAQKYGGSGASNRVSRNDARGRGQDGGPRAGTREAGAGAGRPTQGAGGSRGGAAQRGGSSAGSRDASRGGMSGSKNASLDRAASSRGSSSRQSASRGGGGSRSSSASRGGGGRSGGGMSRGGGGGGGRGGGRR